MYDASAQGVDEHIIIIIRHQIVHKTRCAVATAFCASSKTCLNIKIDLPRPKKKCFQTFKNTMRSSLSKVSSSLMKKGDACKCEDCCTVGFFSFPPHEIC